MEIALEQQTLANLADAIVDQKMNALEDRIHVQEEDANVVKMTNVHL